MPRYLSSYIPIQRRQALSGYNLLVLCYALISVANSSILLVYYYWSIIGLHISPTMHILDHTALAIHKKYTFENKKLPPSLNESTPKIILIQGILSLNNFTINKTNINIYMMPNK
jgi:hypothetical protein